SDSPWQSMAKLNQLIKSLKAGDIVYFEKGSAWDNVRIDINNLAGTASSPIVFSTYGSGANPRFKGSKLMGSFAQNGKIWKCIDKALPDYVVTVRHLIPFVYINETRFETSRYPDNGYLYTNTMGASNYLDDNTQSWAGNYWKNGMAVVRTLSWRWYTRRINDNSANRLNFDAFDRNYERFPTAYLIMNHVNACNNQGEWAQQNDTLWINYTGALSAQKVEAPVIDTIMKVTNSRYIRFENIRIERSVMYNAFVSNSGVIFSNCSLSDAGSFLLLVSNHSDVDIRNSSLSYGRKGGIIYENSQGDIAGNTFRQFAFDGADNTDRIYGVCVQNWWNEGIVNVDRNSFDSINIAYHGHYSNADNYVTRNTITNFGMTIKDAAALYYGTDFTTYNKIARKNIMHNGHNNFVHGIYMDSNTNNVTADSNTISNTNVAVYIHVSKNNKVAFNNIIFPAKDMAFPWNSAIRLDEYSYHFGGEGTPVTGNSISGNNVVLGTTTNELAVAFLRLSSLNSNTFINNKYFNPFGTQQRMFVNGSDYSTYNTYSLSDWINFSGLESGSTYNQPYWPYSSVSATGVSQQDFILLLKNPTDKSMVFDLRNFGAYYMDVKGNILYDYVTVPSYYSMILFYKGKNTNANQAPVVSTQTITLQESTLPTGSIGRVAASDPDAGQKLTYSISGGNTASTFRIDAATGDLYLNSLTTDYATNVTFNLSVTATDNGSPVRSGTAIIKVIIMAENNTPVLANQEFTVIEQTPLPSHVGKVVATDPDPGQLLTYTILSGNNDNLFRIDQQSGDLYLNAVSVSELSSTQYILTISVADNGNPVLKKAAQVIINILAGNNTVYIDPSLEDSPDENGSLAKPYNSWYDVTWMEGYTYLQKSGTTALNDKLTLNAGSINIGSYGEGDKPIIISTTSDFAIRIIEKDKITIKNLTISAPYALYCIYALNANVISIENCVFQNTKGGIKIASGSDITLRYNKFYDIDEAVTNYATDIHIYYNLFVSNTTAVYLLSNASSNKIYNNVFYDNILGIVSGSSSVLINNNIFYLEQMTDKAFVVSGGDLESDNNIFFPDRFGFVSINDQDLQDLQDLQQKYTMDLNSFNTDPLFINALKHNFSIQYGSPAVDAGKQLGMASDIDGNLVPWGAAPDIGAIELIDVTASPGDDIDQKIWLYPNPAQGDFRILLTNNEVTEGKVTIRSVLGTALIMQEFKTNGNGAIEISASGLLSKGIFLVELEAGGTILCTERLVIY
ncbi:MAG: hypothetical protein H6Q21_2279, partial [Bacteroidetes bacterium]|nr:hypothetical protein [Bacteroidota bacterium]